MRFIHDEKDVREAAFLAHMTPTGAHFLKPHRVDLLRKGQ